MYIGVGHSPQTRSFRSCDCTRSRSASELLRSQKTELPQPLDGLLGKDRRHTLCLFLFLFLFACTNTHPQLSRLPDDAVILAFGDSITSGVGAPPGESYPEILHGLINRKVIKSGILGETSGEGLVRLPGELSIHKPRLVLLCMGGNDILRKMDLEKASNNIRQMVRMIRDSGAEVVLIGVPAPGLVLSTASFYKKISGDTGVPLEGSLLADILADNKLKADAIHPNAEGYRLLAQGIAAFLRKAGAVP
jgi:acyl-CoA thioesterase-1